MARGTKKQPPRDADVPVLVDRTKLAPNNSYGEPDFVERGYYVDQHFTCATCQSEETWLATQQKWWFEVAKGYAFSTAKLCRPCRRAEQARRETARKVSDEHRVQKKAR